MNSVSRPVERTETPLWLGKLGIAMTKRNEMTPLINPKQSSYLRHHS